MVALYMPIARYMKDQLMGGSIYLIDKLIKEIIEKKNPTVVGLDTRLEYIQKT